MGCVEGIEGHGHEESHIEEASKVVGSGAIKDLWWASEMEEKRGSFLMRLFALLLTLFSVLVLAQKPKPQLQLDSPKVNWAEEPDGFKGIKFGSTQMEVRQRLTFEACLPDQLGNTICQGSVLVGEYLIPSYFHFANDHFSMIVGHCKPMDCDSLKAIFFERYGKPHEDFEESAADSHVSLWKGKQAAVGVVVKAKSTMFYVALRAYEEERERRMDQGTVDKIKAAAKEL